MSESAASERAAVIRQIWLMPQPLVADGYSRQYTEGWKAALAELCRRVEAGEHDFSSSADLLTRCASVIWAHEARPCNMMPLGAIEQLAEDLRREIFR